MLSRPGPEALRSWPQALYRPGQARPTHRAYEGLGPEALASDSLVQVMDILANQSFPKLKALDDDRSG